MSRRVGGVRALAPIVAAAIGLGFGAPALANMGNPYTPGSPGGEPTGLEQVAIEHESLEIDLRPLASGQTGTVVASYAIRNDGPAKTVLLVFVAASLDGAAARPPSISLDGATVPIATVETVAAPTSWQPPRTTPGLGGSGPLSYVVVRGASGLRFDLVLPAGRHAIRAEYAAVATKAALPESPLVYWQLAYILAPARQWASFGGLDVAVHLPSQWDAASDPPLERRADDLTGAFREIPADSLAITAQAPIPPASNGRPAAALVIVVVAVIAAWRAGRWLGRHRRSSRWAMPLSLVAGIAWTVALGLVLVPPDLSVPGQDSYTYGYGSGALLFFLAPFATGAGFAFAQLLAYVAARRAR